MKTRADVINFYAKKIGAKKYLEIGVQTGATFLAVDVDYKVGVDPDPLSRATINITSDMFFEHNEEKFDIIFVDGLHLWETAARDIHNAVRFLNKGGVIVMDDIAPRKEVHQRRSISDIHWTGDVWKAWFITVSEYRDRFNMFSFDVAFGLGVMQAGKTEIKPPYFNEISANKEGWSYYESNKSRFLNMVSFDK